MHEASIALSILDIITGKCESEGYRGVESVRLKIGRAAGILPDALFFAFDAAKIDTVAQDAELIIESVPLGGVCTACESDFDVEDTYVLNCPRCGSTTFTIRRGYEMEIVEMEVPE